MYHVVFPDVYRTFAKISTKTSSVGVYKELAPLLNTFTAYWFDDVDLIDSIPLIAPEWHDICKLYATNYLYIKEAELELHQRNLPPGREGEIIAWILVDWLKVRSYRDVYYYISKIMGCSKSQLLQLLIHAHEYSCTLMTLLIDCYEHRDKIDPVDNTQLPWGAFFHTIRSFLRRNGYDVKPRERNIATKREHDAIDDIGRDIQRLKL